MSNGSKAPADNLFLVLPTNSPSTGAQARATLKERPSVDLKGRGGPTLFQAPNHKPGDLWRLIVASVIFYYGSNAFSTTSVSMRRDNNGYVIGLRKNKHRAPPGTAILRKTELDGLSLSRRKRDSNHKILETYHCRLSLILPHEANHFRRRKPGKVIQIAAKLFDTET